MKYLLSDGISFGVILFLFLIFLLHLSFFSLTFNSFKINIIEMVLSNDNILTINYYLLKKLKEVSFDMNKLQFRTEFTYMHNNEIAIHDSNYKRLFKIRASNGINGKDLENIIISFRNAGIKELEKKGFDKKTYYDSLKIVKVNYLSKDVFRNFWYV